jgi:hypothetical protein
MSLHSIRILNHRPIVSKRVQVPVRIVDAREVERNAGTTNKRSEPNEPNQTRT